MKSNEILQALSLTTNVKTRNYCSKLANVFEFLKSLKDAIVKAVILETGFTIDTNGKVLEVSKLEKQYKESRLNDYRYNDKETKALSCKESYLRSQLCKVNDLLWKKRKNKSNAELESQKEQLQSDLNNIEACKQVLIDIEEKRLETITPTIVEIRKELHLLEGNKIEVETKHGNYCFYLPIDNGFYYAVLSLLNIGYEVAKVERVAPIHTFYTYPELLDNIKKAMPFTSDDELRPAMQSICLDITGEGIQVVSTDAHRMYYSKRLSFDGCKEDMKLLIDSVSIKALCRVKPDYNNVLTINVYADNTATFNDVEVRLLDARFPDYKCVIPKYDTYMEFDRKQFMDNVKKVKVYANKSTAQVNFHLNGSIAMHSQDVDFSFEGDADMPYINKSFEDTDIAFNGNFINDCLNAFKDKIVKMYTNGLATKAAIFTNGIDNVLLMPLMINS